MAVFKRLSSEDLQNNFTHYGGIYGCCPIYVGDPDGDCRVSTRNWVPEWPLDLMEAIYDLAIQTRMMFDPYFMPVFAIKLTGLIAKDQK